MIRTITEMCIPNKRPMGTGRPPEWPLCIAREAPTTTKRMYSTGTQLRMPRILRRRSRVLIPSATAVQLAARSGSQKIRPSSSHAPITTASVLSTSRATSMG
jgi:hypothetical protein